MDVSIAPCRAHRWSMLPVGHVTLSAAFRHRHAETQERPPAAMRRGSSYSAFKVSRSR